MAQVHIPAAMLVLTMQDLSYWVSSSHLMVEAPCSPGCPRLSSQPAPVDGHAVRLLRWRGAGGWLRFAYVTQGHSMATLCVCFVGAALGIFPYAIMMRRGAVLAGLIVLMLVPVLALLSPAVGVSQS
jgi:predicted cobalt transporter CbtA